MRINHNIASMSTQASLFKVNRDMSKSIQKLSTGLRINSAADDAAGLGVSENLRTQVNGMEQSLRNTQDTIALLNIADGALGEQADILQRMRELVVQAKNDTYTDTERGYMGQEFTSLGHELDRIAQTTRYNGMQIFATPEASGNTNGGGGIYGSNSNNSAPETAHKTINATSLPDNPLGSADVGSENYFNMMIGGNFSQNDANNFAGGMYFKSGASNMITIQFGQMDTNALLTTDPSGAFWGPTPQTDFSGLGLVGDFSWDPSAAGDAGDQCIAAGAGANASVHDKLNLILQVIDGDGSSISNAMKTNVFGSNANSPTGLDRVNKMRAYIGAMTNRLEHTVNNLMNQVTNTQAAESQIRDVDMASETANFTRSQILTQSATAMLSQANSLPQGVLGLLK